MLLDCHAVTLARLYIPQKIVSVAQTVLVKILSKNFHKGIIDFLQIVVLRVLYKIGKSPNHTGLSFVCMFTFSVFGYNISVIKYRIFVRFCQECFIVSIYYLEHIHICVQNKELTLHFYI